MQVGTVCLNLGTMTNNQAEYIGLLAGAVAAKRVGVQSLKILGDSQLVVRQARTCCMLHIIATHVDWQVDFRLCVMSLFMVCILAFQCKVDAPTDTKQCTAVRSGYGSIPSKQCYCEKLVNSGSSCPVHF